MGGVLAAFLSCEIVCACVVVVCVCVCVRVVVVFMWKGTKSFHPSTL